MTRILALCVIVFLIPACTWVNLTAPAEKVRILSLDEVKNCQRVGTTTVSTKATVGGIKRKYLKIQEELNTLARNGAIDLNGDTVVPITSQEDGKQVFDVYRCINP